MILNICFFNICIFQVIRNRGNMLLNLVWSFLYGRMFFLHKTCLLAIGLLIMYNIIVFFNELYCNLCKHRQKVLNMLHAVSPNINKKVHCGYISKIIVKHHMFIYMCFCDIQQNYWGSTTFSKKRKEIE